MALPKSCKSFKIFPNVLQDFYQDLERFFPKIMQVFFDDLSKIL